MKELAVQKSRREVRWLGVIAIAVGVLLLVLVQFQGNRELRISADSRQYHFAAVNLAAGLGYYETPLAEPSLYDAWTRATFPHYFESAPDISTKSPAAVTPGYPVILAAIYSIHGVSPSAVIRYQQLMVFLVGVLMVILGWQLLRHIGVGCAAFAALLLGTNREFGYPVTALLTEMAATVLLLAALCAAVWAARRRALSETIVGVVFALAVLVRPALIFAAVFYGLYLLFGATESRWRRALAYAAPCLLLLGSWTAYTSLQHGRFVPLASYGTDTIKMGLRGETGASLTASGVTAESVQRRELRQELRLALAQPRESLAVVNGKLKEALERMPRFLWDAVALGFALLVSTMVRRDTPGGHEGTLRVSLSGWFPWRRRRVPLALLLGFGLMLFAVAAGWSTPVTQLGFLLLPVLGLFLRLEIADPGRRLPLPEGQPLYLLAWYFGFLAIIVLTIGLSRYMRPFLPVFYLVAVCAIPYALLWLAALTEGAWPTRALAFAWDRPEKRPA